MTYVASASYHERPSSHWTGWGQWIALVTMTLDHLARYLATDAWHLGWVDSSVGRIAFPLFAGMVAWHGLFNTRDPLRYARRVMIIGLLARICCEHTFLRLTNLPQDTAWGHPWAKRVCK